MAFTALGTYVKNADSDDFQPSDPQILENTLTEYFDPAADFSIHEDDSLTEYFDAAGFSVQENAITQVVEHIELSNTVEHAKPAEEQARIEHFELAQGSRSSLPEAELDCHGRVLKLRICDQPTAAGCVELDRPGAKLIRLSNETFPDLGGRQLEFLSDLCLAAHYSEEFFLSVATNEWVRTSVTCDKPPKEFFCEESIVEERSKLSKLISSIIVHSNVLPRDPFWTKVRNGTCSERVHFPYSILKEAIQEGNTLMKKLEQWREKREECDIIDQHHGLKRAVDGNTKEGPLRLFWEIRANVKPIKQFAEGSDGAIWLVTWRGGRFVRKDRKRIPNNDNSVVDTELNVVEKLSHPHIVFSFGVSYAENKSSLFMEYMQNDLSHCIIDRVRITGDTEPPFSHQDSIDILLQFAKAMAHMHKENVVHGDLKSLNILISEFSISENVKHFLVKVADFGSARLMNCDLNSDQSLNFKPGAATTKYAAPELLKMRVDKNAGIPFPKKLDVYSFGIVAFEVLTGEEPYSGEHSPSRMKKGIIEDTLRPSLRADCQKDNFLHDERLLSLIESCWQGNPSERPSFPNIIEALNSVRAQILKPVLWCGHRQRQGKSVDDPCAFEGQASILTGQHKSRIPLQVHSTCTEGRPNQLFNFSAMFQR